MAGRARDDARPSHVHLRHGEVHSKPHPETCGAFPSRKRSTARYPHPANGGGRYFKRIYQRFALDSDHYITGKFEFGDSAHESEVPGARQTADTGLGEARARTATSHAPSACPRNAYGMRRRAGARGAAHACWHATISQRMALRCFLV